MPQIFHPAARLLAQQAGVRLLLFRLIESEAELLQLLPPSRDYAQQVADFASARRRREWLAARVLLHDALGDRAALGYRATGAPYLEGTDQPFVSVSHTQGLVALALAPRPVGLDVEVVTPRAARLAEKFLSPAEEELLRVAPLLPTVEATATLLWSAKESAFKRASMHDLSVITDIHLRRSAQSAPAAAEDVERDGSNEAPGAGLEASVLGRAPWWTVRFTMIDGAVLTLV